MAGKQARSKARTATGRGPRGPLVRALRDGGMAVWFGGSLMGVVALDRAVDDLSYPEGLSAADEAWDRWNALGGIAVAANLLAGAVAVWGNKSRIVTQKGMAPQLAAEGIVTLAALAATVAARTFRKQAVRAAGDPAPTHDATSSSPDSPPEVVRARQRLRIAEYAVPALTGASVVINARTSEDQRPVRTLRQVAVRCRSRS